MYELVGGKLVILPSWLEESLNAHGKSPKDILTIEGLSSILSVNDVEFYKKQVNTLINHTRNNHKQHPRLAFISALLSSFSVAHANSSEHIIGQGASGLNESVTLPRLYGKDFLEFDFFTGMDMVSYLPRDYGLAMGDSRPSVKPVLRAIFPDRERHDSRAVFALSFELNDMVNNGDGRLQNYQKIPDSLKQWLSDVVRLLVDNYGFESVTRTKIFDIYCQDY